jgi:hypothetical protein
MKTLLKPFGTISDKQLSEIQEKEAANLMRMPKAALVRLLIEMDYKTPEPDQAEAEPLTAESHARDVKTVIDLIENSERLHLKLSSRLHTILRDLEDLTDAVHLKFLLINPYRYELGGKDKIEAGALISKMQRDAKKDLGIE